MGRGISTAHREASANGNVARGSCPHHWVIDMAQGPVSKGKCEVCGTSREFHNFLSDCLANKNEESYEQWLAKEGRQERKRAKGGRSAVYAMGED
jgi:hypothetical protein